MREFRRIKILLLGHSDTRQEGHVYSIMKSLPADLYDVRLIVLENKYPAEGYKSFFDTSTRKGVVLKKALLRMQRLKLSIINKCRITISPREAAVHHYSFRSCNFISANNILSQCGDWIPDIIHLAWTATFISPKTIYDLYCLTKATFLYHFVDEQHLTGGCHYPAGCNGYMNGCAECPVLERGSIISQYQMAESLKYTKDIPKIFLGTNYDMQLAKTSPLFRNCIYLKPRPDILDEISYDKKECREFFGLKDDSFVIMSGAQALSARKGFKYAIEAVNKLAEMHSNICFLLLGPNENENEVRVQLNPNVNLVMPGFLNKEGLLKAFCASNCHLSTSIADSGPMMVNYAISLACPTVSFGIGVALDLIIHKTTGYLAAYKDSQSLCDGLDFIYSLSVEERQAIKNNCIALCEKIKNQRPWQMELYDIIKEV